MRLNRHVRLLRVVVSAALLAFLAVVLMPVAPAHAATFYVESNADTGGLPASCNDGDGCTLRQAILLANNTAGADDIYFDTEVAGLTITVGSGLPTITDDVNFHNSSTGHVYIDGSSIRPFQISTATALTVLFYGYSSSELIYIQNGTATNGGCIRIAGAAHSVTLRGVRMQGCAAGASGGAIYSIDGASITLRGTYIGTGSAAGQYNTAGTNGGGISMTGGTLTMLDNSWIVYNEAGSSGGGIQAAGVTITTPDNSFTYIRGNTADGSGGGIHLTGDSSMTCDACNFAFNRADDDVSGGGSGGAINIIPNAGNSIDLIIDESVFDQNYAARGGGIAIAGNGDDIDVDITYSLFYNNIAANGNGGGFSFGENASNTGANTIDITYTSFTGNTATAHGGAIEVDTGMAAPPFFTFQLDNCTLSGNTADSDTSNNGDGGGIHLGTPAGITPQVTVNDTTIAYNTAYRGGGIFQGGGALYTLTNTILAQNTGNSSGPDCQGTITSNDYNLVGDNSNCTFTAQTNDQVGTGASPIDPLLDPLANNGGPADKVLWNPPAGYSSTPTRALQALSPARDLGSSVNADDQRGIARPQGSADDIGAYEVAYITISGLVWEDDGFSGGICGNGVQEGGELGDWMDGYGVDIYLDDGDGVLDAGDGAPVYSITFVAGSGYSYSYTGAASGFPVTYHIQFLPNLAPFWGGPRFLTLQDAGASDLVDSDPNRTTGVYTHTFNAAGTAANVDAGWVWPIVILDDPTGVLPSMLSSTLLYEDPTLIPAREYDVYLCSAPLPGDTVDIDITYDNNLTADGSVDDLTNSPVMSPTATLSFTDLTWNVPQTVTVTTIDDFIAEGTEWEQHNPIAVNTTTSTSTEYVNAEIGGTTWYSYQGSWGPDPRPIQMQIIDNDVAGVNVLESGGDTRVDENGGTDSYTVWLNSQPLATVTVTLAADAQIDIRDAFVGGAYSKNVTLTFDPSCSGSWGCWDYVYTIDVIGTDDNICETNPHFGLITHSVTSTDPNYNGWPAPSVTPLITEDDDCEEGRPPSGGPSAYDPAISKDVDPMNAVPGETVVWTLTVWNPGSETLGFFIVNDPIPGMFDIVDVQTELGTATVNGQVVWVEVPGLAPGQSFRVIITTVANELATAGEVCNTAYVGSHWDDACVSMFPGLLPETGDQAIENAALYGAAAAISVVGAAVGGSVLIRRRRTATE